MAWKGGHRKHNRLSDEFRQFVGSAQKPWNYNVEGKHWTEKELRIYLRKLMEDELLEQPEYVEHTLGELSQEENNEDDEFPLPEEQPKKKRGRPAGVKVHKTTKRKYTKNKKVEPDILNSLDQKILELEQDLAILKRAKELIS